MNAVYFNNMILWIWGIYVILRIQHNQHFFFQIVYIYITENVIIYRTTITQKLKLIHLDHKSRDSVFLLLDYLSQWVLASMLTSLHRVHCSIWHSHGNNSLPLHKWEGLWVIMSHFLKVSWHWWNSRQKLMYSRQNWKIGEVIGFEKKEMIHDVGQCGWLFGYLLKL